MMLKYIILAVLIFGGSSSNAHESKNTIPVEVEYRRCGDINLDMQASTETMSQTDFFQFPWTVAISKKDDFDFCGGSIIHPKVILTAAQCFAWENAEDLKVIGGRWLSDNTTNYWPQQVRRVSRIIIRRNYSRVNFSNDFALLVLTMRFILSDNVNTICLASVNTISDESRCFADSYVGVVREHFIARSKNTTLQQIVQNPSKLQIVSHGRCEGSLRGTSLGENYSLPMSSICAENEYGGAFCDDYPGSSLVCLLSGSRNRYVQVGIASWIAVCNKQGVPGMYGKVENARVWIDKQLDILGLEKWSYFDSNLKNITISKMSPMKPRGCGMSHPDRIDSKNCHKSPDDNFPWTVAIWRKDISNIVCAGSLIHPKVILTAAQCVEGKSPRDLKVIAGRWTNKGSIEDWPHQERNVSKIIIHGNYSKFDFYYDFALVVLSRQVVLDDNINTVCLPNSNYISDDEHCLISNSIDLMRHYYFNMNLSKRRFNYVPLKFSKLQVLSHDGCEINLRKTALGLNFTLAQSTICAGESDGTAFCEGLIGDPLVSCGFFNKYQFVQIGVLSWLTVCDKPSVPGMYANVVIARSWIDEQMKILGLDISYYVIPVHMET